MKKYLKYTLKGFAIAAGIFLLLYIAAYIYLTVNKKEIIKEIKDQIAEKLNGKVQVGDIDVSFFSTFPNLSIIVKDMSIKDTLFSQHKHEFFRAEKIYAKIGIIRAIRRNNPLSGAQVENGQLYVYTDSTGYTNSYLFSPKVKHGAPTGKSPAKTELDDIKLLNIRLVLDDQKKKKLYDFDVTKFICDIKTLDSGFALKTKADVLIHSLAFNTVIGTYAKEAGFQGDFKVNFNTVRKQLSFEDIDVKIKAHPFTLSGEFNFTATPTFRFKAVTKDIDFAFAKNLLTEKISTALSIVKLSKPIDEVTAEVSGPLNGGDPLVNAKWKDAGTDVEAPFANFKNCSFTGAYTNELIPGLPRKDPNSRIQLHDFAGTWEGLDLKCQNVYVDNLEFPMINCDVKTDFELARLNDLLASNTIDLKGGKGSVELTYSGPILQNSNNNTAINGKVNFYNGVIMYEPRNMEVTDVNGNIVFKNSDVFVNDFRLNVKGNKIVMNGAGKNLLALIKTNPGKIFLDWNIYSPSLDFGSFTSLLKKRVAAAPKKRSSAGLQSLSDNLDQVVDQANFRLNVKAGELKYKRFMATNVKAAVELMNENWLLNTISLQHAGGSMVISGNMLAKSNDLYECNVKMNIENADVNKVMYAFDNFGQSGIGAENLRGKLSSVADVTMDIDRNLETPSDINGFVNFSLKNGALMHYEPLQKIQTVVFKKRNFDEIYFAELKDRLDIKDRDIRINRMEIQSTVLTLFVDGVYSLKGNTDLSIQVPLSNLKKRDEDYKPENKGAESKAGASIFVRGQPDKDGVIQFKLDLFKRFRKNNNKDNKQEDQKKSEASQKD